MGHYASEMMCSRCRRVRCVCPPEPVKANQNWIVEDDFSIITVADFDKKYAKRTITVGGYEGLVDGMPMMKRMGKKEFSDKKKAQKHAKSLAKLSLKELERRVKKLTKFIEKMP